MLSVFLLQELSYKWVKTTKVIGASSMENSFTFGLKSVFGFILYNAIF